RCRATACRQGRPVHAIGAKVRQVGLHGGRIAARADSGEDARRAATGVLHDQAGDVLALVEVVVRVARPGPVGTGIVGNKQAGLGADNDRVEVVRTGPDLADRLVLREAESRGWRIVRIEYVLAKHAPGLAPVDAFQYARGTKRERAVAKIAGTEVNHIRIARHDMDFANRRAGDRPIVGDIAPGRAGAAAIGRFPQPATVGSRVNRVQAVDVRTIRIDG